MKADARRPGLSTRGCSSDLLQRVLQPWVSNCSYSAERCKIAGEQGRDREAGKGSERGLYERVSAGMDGSGAIASCMWIICCAQL